ncbi:MAG: hypothetical protein IAF08_15715 [Rhizobacter sp.]|nr:hypothetical protein [Chlorobiales bacterium]
MNRKSAAIPIFILLAAVALNLLGISALLPFASAQTIPRPENFKPPLTSPADSVRKTSPRPDSSKASTDSLGRTAQPFQIIGTDSLSLLAPQPATAPDTLSKFYKFLSPSVSFFSSPARITNTTRDFLFHPRIEDYFAEVPQFYLRDKSEFGQTNDLLVMGLGARYQTVLLDDALLSDPITMTAIYQQLSSESFSELSFYSGYTSHLYSSSPNVIESRTENFVAAKGYTKLHYWQYRSGSLKTDGTFSLNISERLNFYGGYARESNDGAYQNSVSTGTAFAFGGRNASSYQGDKIRVRFRYQFGRKSYLTVSETYNALKSQPFGGVDYRATLRRDSTFSFDLFNELAATVVNEQVRRTTLTNVFKLDLETALPFIEQIDSSNLFKAWVYAGNFYNEYQSPLNDSVVALNIEQSLRLAAGASQALNLDFFSLGLRAAYTLDRIEQQNTLANQSGENILPLTNTLDLNGGIKFRFEKLLFGQALEVAAAAGLTTKVISGTQGEDAVAAYPYGGAGGEVNFPIPFAADSSRVKAFLNFSNTRRTPSLQEVFLSVEKLTGSHSWQPETINKLELGGELVLGKFFDARASFVSQAVLAPVAVITTPAADTTFLGNARFESLTNDRLNYTALGLALRARVWQLEAALAGTFVIDYSLLKNPDAAFSTGLQLGSDSSDARSSGVFYLPKVHGSISLFYRERLFGDKLEFKAGVIGYFYSAYSAALRRREDQNLTYFNVIEQDGGIRDNNLQYGVLPASARLDFQAWGRLGSAVIFLTWENILDATIIKTSLYPLTPRFIRIGFSWEILN